MSTPRSSLYTILKREFRNPWKRKLALDSAKNILQNTPELATRIFDKFPSLLPQNKIAELTHQFQDIFTQLDDESISDTNLVFEADKKSISIWEKKIANIAITELLNEHGIIKNELIELFEWQNFQDQLKSPALICSIVCAFVGAVNQIIMHNLSSQLSNNSATYLAVCGYINKNYRTWVNQILESKQQSSENKEGLAKTDKWYIEKTLVLGAVAAAATILFFKNLNLGNNNHPMEEKKINTLRP